MEAHEEGTSTTGARSGKWYHTTYKLNAEEAGTKAVYTPQRFNGGGPVRRPAQHHGNALRGCARPQGHSLPSAHAALQAQQVHHNRRRDPAGRLFWHSHASLSCVTAVPSRHRACPAWAWLQSGLAAGRRPPSSGRSSLHHRERLQEGCCTARAATCALRPRAEAVVDTACARASGLGPAGCCCAPPLPGGPPAPAEPAPGGPPRRNQAGTQEVPLCATGACSGTACSCSTAAVSLSPSTVAMEDVRASTVGAVTPEAPGGAGVSVGAVAGICGSCCCSCCWAEPVSSCRPSQGMTLMPLACSYKQARPCGVCTSRGPDERRKTPSACTGAQPKCKDCKTASVVSKQLLAADCAATPKPTTSTSWPRVQRSLKLTG